MTMRKKAHVIVVGNEKGGSGKSTVAMHLATEMLYMGYRVGCIDLDARQATLNHYIENRKKFVEANGLKLPIPSHKIMHPSAASHGLAAQAGDEARLEEMLMRMRDENDVLLLDTPGSDHYLSRAGHSYADTLITPLNDSFIDLNVLARVDHESMTIGGISHYAEMVWEIKKKKAQRDGGSINWLVLRNRLTNLNSRNKRDMEKLLRELAKRIGFTIVPGLAERVIFREMFLKGVTLLDLREENIDMPLSMSHIAARQEFRVLIDAIGLSRLAGEAQMEAG